MRKMDSLDQQSRQINEKIAAVVAKGEEAYEAYLSEPDPELRANWWRIYEVQERKEQALLEGWKSLMAQKTLEVQKATPAPMTGVHNPLASSESAKTHGRNLHCTHIYQFPCVVSDAQCFQT